MRSTVDYIKNNKLLLLVIIPAFIVHMLIILPSGSQYCFENKCGIFFWGAHAHDAIWHLAIIASSFNTFPFEAPTFAGSVLSGYNYLLDLIMFAFSKVGISPLFSYFKLFPVIWFIVMILAAVAFARKLHKSAVFMGILLFFIFFAGSFSYLLTLYHRKTIWGSSGLLAMQAGLTLTNLQFAFSLAVLLYILNLIKSESKNIVLLSVLAGINIALKFYAGVISLFIIGVYLLGKLVLEKNLKSFFVSSLIVSVISAIFVIVFYNPSQSFSSGSTFSYSPFATVHSIIEEPEQFYMKDMVNARYFLQNVNKFSPKLLRIELTSLLLFLFFNFGTRIIGLLSIGIKLAKRSINKFDIYLLTTMLFAIFMATFFVQKGIWWNTIQFLYYALFLGNIFAAEAIYLLLKKNRSIGIICAAVIIIFTIPTSIDIVKGFSTFPSPAYLPQDERLAFEFLKKQPNGIVFAPVFDAKDKDQTTAPYALSNYDDTSYVSAFSGKPTYANDKVQLELLGLPYKPRYDAVKAVDCNIFKSVTYIYHPLYEKEKEFLPCIKQSKSITEIFRNDSVVIYSTKK